MLVLDGPLPPSLTPCANVHPLLIHFCLIHALLRLLLVSAKPRYRGLRRRTARVSNAATDKEENERKAAQDEKERKGREGRKYVTDLIRPFLPPFPLWDSGVARREWDGEMQLK